MATNIDDIPVELIEEIFMLSAEPPTSHGTARSASPHSAPLLFMAVSKRWREIAVGLPLLWNGLTMLNSQDVREKMCPGPNEWIARAKGLPLSISLTISGSSNDLLLQLLLPNLSRVRILSLSMPLEFYSVFAQLPSNSAPLLEEVRFTTTTFNPRDFSRIPCVDLGMFPALRSVALNTRLKFAGLMKRGAAFNIPWFTLTTIDIREPGLHEMELQGLMLQCSSVVSCTIMLTRPTTGQITWLIPEGPTPLACLKELRIAYNDSYLASDRSDRLEEFLNPFVLPSLETLKIKSAHGGMIRNMSAMALVHLQSRSSFRLKALSLVDFHFDTDSLLPFLQSVPTITTLRLETMILRDDQYQGCPFHELFQFLACEESTPPHGDILPQLKNICVVYQLSTYYWRSMRKVKKAPLLDQGELLDMIESRVFHNDTYYKARDIRRLEVAKVVWKNLHNGQASFCDEIYARMKGLQEVGFDFVFNAKFHDEGFEEPAELVDDQY